MSVHNLVPQFSWYIITKSFQPKLSKSQCKLASPAASLFVLQLLGKVKRKELSPNSLLFLFYSYPQDFPKEDGIEGNAAALHDGPDGPQKDVVPFGFVGLQDLGHGEGGLRLLGILLQEKNSIRKVMFNSRYSKEYRDEELFHNEEMSYLERNIGKEESFQKEYVRNCTVV